MKALWPILKLMMTERKAVLLAVLLGFLAAGATVGLLASSGYLISAAALQPALYTLTSTIVLVRFFGIVRATSRYGERYFSHKATFTILANIRTYYYDRIEPLVPEILHKYRSGDILSRIVGDVEELQFFFLRVVYPPFVMVLVFVSTLFFTLYFSVYAAVLLLIGWVIAGFLMPAWFAFRQRFKNEKVREKRGNLSADTIEFFQGMQELSLYRRLDEREVQLMEKAEDYAMKQEQEARFLSYSETGNVMIGLIITWGIIFLGTLEVTSGRLDGVFMAMLILVSLSVFESANPLAAFPQHATTARQAAGRLHETIGADHEMMSGQLKGNDRFSDNEAEITVDHATFSYQRELRPALEEVTLTIPYGQHVAIIGASGSGKSTLMSLLTGLACPQSGTVRFGSHDLRDLEAESFWKKLNITLQDNHFFYGTVRDNLKIAGETLEDHELIEALTLVKLSDWSLDRQVLERGSNLSGGEKQRLALARAWLKRGDYWLLDEPMASLDHEMEAWFLRHLLEKERKKTVIVISHHLQHLQLFDRIIVMADGKIIEEGPPETLINQGGELSQMLEIMG